LRGEVTSSPFPFFFPPPPPPFFFLPPPYCCSFFSFFFFFPLFPAEEGRSLFFSLFSSFLFFFSSLPFFYFSFPFHHDRKRCSRVQVSLSFSPFPFPTRLKGNSWHFSFFSPCLLPSIAFFPFSPLARRRFSGEKEEAQGAIVFLFFFFPFLFFLFPPLSPPLTFSKGFRARRPPFFFSGGPAGEDPGPSFSLFFPFLAFPFYFNEASAPVPSPFFPPFFFFQKRLIVGKAHVLDSFFFLLPSLL